jgi:hypothetical protein
MLGTGDGSIQSPLGVENDLVQQSPEPHVPDGHYTARALVRDRREVTVRDMNATCRDQKLTNRSPWHSVSQSRWRPHPM